MFMNIAVTVAPKPRGSSKSHLNRIRVDRTHHTRLYNSAVRWNVRSFVQVPVVDVRKRHEDRRPETYVARFKVEIRDGRKNRRSSMHLVPREIRATHSPFVRRMKQTAGESIDLIRTSVRQMDQNNDR